MSESVVRLKIARCDLETLVDADVAEMFAGYRLNPLRNKVGRLYVYVSGGGTQTNVKGLLHRLILNPGKGLVCDHINGDTLDNRRSNLRAVTHSENRLNRASSNHTHPDPRRDVNPATKPPAIQRPDWSAHIPDVLTPRAVGKLLGVSGHQIARLCAGGVIPSTRLEKNTYRIQKQDLRVWVGIVLGPEKQPLCPHLLTYRVDREGFLGQLIPPGWPRSC